MHILITTSVSLCLALGVALTLFGGWTALPSVVYWTLPGFVAGLAILHLTAKMIHGKPAIPRRLAPMLKWILAAQIVLVTNALSALAPIENLERVLQLTLACLLTCLFYNIGRQHGDLRGTFATLVALAVVATVLKRSPTTENGVTNENTVAVIAGLTGLYLVVVARTLVGRVALMAVSLVLVGLFLESRTAVAALAVSYSVLILTKRLPSHVARIATSLLVVMPCVVTVIIAASRPEISSPLNMALVGRARVWHIVMERSDWVGMGAGSWSALRESSGQELILPWKTFGSLTAGGAHNVYAQALAELGWIGLLTVVSWLLLGVLWPRLQSAHITSVFIFAAFHGFGEIALGPVTTVNSWPNWLMWAMIGLLVGREEGLRCSDAKKWCQ